MVRYTNGEPMREGDTVRCVWDDPEIRPFVGVVKATEHGFMWIHSQGRRPTTFSSCSYEKFEYELIAGSFDQFLNELES